MPAMDRTGFGETARGVSTNLDCLRVCYRLARGGRVRGIVVTARPNTNVPTAAQQAGFARVVAYNTPDQMLNPLPAGTSSDLKGGGRILCDHDVGVPYGAGGPSYIPLNWKAQPGDTITVEVSPVQDNAGGVANSDNSVTLLGDDEGERDITAR